MGFCVSAKSSPACLLSCFENKINNLKFKINTVFIFDVFKIGHALSIYVCSFLILLVFLMILPSFFGYLTHMVL